WIATWTCARLLSAQSDRSNSNGFCQQKKTGESLKTRAAFFPGRRPWAAGPPLRARRGRPLKALALRHVLADALDRVRPHALPALGQVTDEVLEGRRVDGDVVAADPVKAKDGPVPRGQRRLEHCDQLLSRQVLHHPGAEAVEIADARIVGRLSNAARHREVAG